MNFIGIDIGGTKCSISLGGIVEGDMKILDRSHFLTIPGNPEKMLEKFAEEIIILLSKNRLPSKDISGIGISCGGPLDSGKGIILSPPNLPGWGNIHIVEYFKTKF